MRKFILMLFVALSILYGCSKESENDPDLASLVTGTYQVYQMTLNNQTVSLPNATTSVGMTVVKNTNNLVSFTMTVNQNGTRKTQELGDASLTDKGNNLVDLYDGSEYIGYAGNNKINLSGISDDGQVMKILARK